MPYQVSLTPQAEVDLETILAFIQRGSQQGAQTWFSRWLDVLDELSNDAEQRLTAPENRDHAETIYNTFFETRYGNRYRCLYIIREDVIYILHIRGFGQDILKPHQLSVPD